MAVLVVAVLLPATWVVGRNRGEVVNSSEASPVQAAALKVVEPTEKMGQIMAPDPIPVIAPVGGAIVVVSVDEGTEVKAGEVLAILAHDDTKLVAPIAGVISRRSVNRGSVVRPDGAAPFHITPATPLRLVIEVDAKTSRSLRASSTASFQAHATNTDAAADKTRAFKARFSSVRAEPNGAGSLRYLASFTTEGTGAKVAAGMKVPVIVNR